MVLDVSIQDEVITGFLGRITHHGRSINRACHLHHEPRSNGKGECHNSPLVYTFRYDVRYPRSFHSLKVPSFSNSCTPGPTTFIYRHGREHFQTVVLIKGETETGTWV